MPCHFDENFNLKEQLQSFRFKVHILISCSGCLLSGTLKHKVLFSNKSGQSKNFQTLLCIMVKNKKPHVKVLTNRFLFEWSHRRILSTDVKVRTTVQNSNIHSGPSEYVKFNKIEK